MLRRVLAVLLVTATVTLGASSLRGQGVGTQAKRAARNAAAKTDAHTNAMQGTRAVPKPAARSANGNGSGPQPAPPPSAPPQVKQTAAPTAQSGARSGDDASVSVRGGKDEVAFRREAFTYGRSGRRDPFLSLLHSNDLRPMINDLKLVAVLYDPVGRSWAVMRDMTTKEQYRVKVGQQLGRMRVTQIHPKSVTFIIEEIGFSRQQTLALNDSKEREP
jgi:hypothetical protein